MSGTGQSERWPESSARRLEAGRGCLTRGQLGPEQVFVSVTRGSSAETTAARCAEAPSW